MPKILIIEDEVFLRELIVRKLKNEGFEVSQAITGKEGIKKVKDEKIDLILLDLVLPDTEKWEVMKELKKDPVLAKIPIIILSNLGQKEDIETGLKLGATDFLIKAHFAPHEIIEKIKNVLKL